MVLLSWHQNEDQDGDQEETQGQRFICFIQTGIDCSNRYLLIFVMSYLHRLLGGDICDELPAPTIWR